MSQPIDWNNPDLANTVRVIPKDAYDGPINTSRWRHARVMPGLGETLIYPLCDGPGIGLLVFLPPLLWLFTLPIFDVISLIDPFGRASWALGLLILPVFLPMMFGLVMVFGYTLLYLGHMLVASAMGENDHPRWPEWNPADISEGVARWLWAGIFGIALGGFPVVAYWINCGDIDWVDRIIFIELVMVGAAYTLMALAAALLHEQIIAANPYIVLVSIFRVGWDYVFPSLVASVALAFAATAIWALLYHLPSMWTEALAIWAFWVFLLYEAMVVVRVMGLTYHAHARDLGWFRRRPKWAGTTRQGTIYTNS
jgi:hypothetical protein